jgi:exonuclease III
MASTVKKLNLTFGILNVNSFNVSTLGTRNSKSYLKIEGLTQKKLDILFICDCRLKDNEKEISKMMGLNRNASYKFYANSNKESRGVAIAIKRNIVHECLEWYKSLDQNVILCKIKIKNVLMVIGAVYGPNGNDPEFFRILRRKIELWDCPFIIGGDFNTILDMTVGDNNLDKSGGGGNSPQP